MYSKELERVLNGHLLADQQSLMLQDKDVVLRIKNGIMFLERMINPIKGQVVAAFRKDPDTGRWNVRSEQEQKMLDECWHKFNRALAPKEADDEQNAGQDL